MNLSSCVRSFRKRKRDCNLKYFGKHLPSSDYRNWIKKQISGNISTMIKDPNFDWEIVLENSSLDWLWYDASLLIPAAKIERIVIPLWYKNWDWKTLSQRAFINVILRHLDLPWRLDQIRYVQSGSYKLLLKMKNNNQIWREFSSDFIMDMHRVDANPLLIWWERHETYPMEHIKCHNDNLYDDEFDKLLGHIARTISSWRTMDILNFCHKHVQVIYTEGISVEEYVNVMINKSRPINSRETTKEMINKSRSINDLEDTNEEYDLPKTNLPIYTTHDKPKFIEDKIRDTAIDNLRKTPLKKD